MVVLPEIRLPVLVLFPMMASSVPAPVIVTPVVLPIAVSPASLVPMKLHKTLT